MKILLYSSFLLLIFSCAANSTTQHISAIEQFQKELNEEYQNSKKSPLRGDHLKNFTVHPFFPIDLKYRVVAKFTTLKNSPQFEFPTSSGKAKSYKAYGIAEFSLGGEKQRLTIYQSQDLMKKEEYKDHLFLPFHDLTNGHETYGGGKYLDLTIPTSEVIILDFNQSYQPYCAYNAYDYSCPIVPKENTISIRIEAGVQYLNTYFPY